MKKFCVIIVGIIALFILIFYLLNNNNVEIKDVKNIKKDVEKIEKISDYEYNKEYIRHINEININNKLIKNKYKFVYVSDLHVSVADENEEDERIRNALSERYNEFLNNNLNHVSQIKIFNEIIDFTNNYKPDALLLGGDIIDSPSESNFRLLRTNLNEKLKIKYLYTLGNHDWSFPWDYHTENAEEMFYPIFDEFMNDINVSYLEYEDLIILAVNDSKDQIDEEAIEKIKNVLEKNKPTIVMMHVPISTMYISQEAFKLRNRVSAIGENGIEPNDSTEKALDLILSDKYKVFYIISGHVHFSINDRLTDEIIENVSAPAYAGEINLIKIND